MPTDQATLLEVSDDGETITLLDGSRWSVDPGDISTAIVWSPTAPVELEKVEGATYTHLLTNQSNGSSVRINREPKRKRASNQS